MSVRLRQVDVVIIGMGIVGSIVAKELAAAGYLKNSGSLVAA